MACHALESTPMSSHSTSRAKSVANRRNRKRCVHLPCLEDVELPAADQLHEGVLRVNDLQSN